MMVTTAVPIVVKHPDVHIVRMLAQIIVPYVPVTQLVAKILILRMATTVQHILAKQAAVHQRRIQALTTVSFINLMVVQRPLRHSLHSILA